MIKYNPSHSYTLFRGGLAAWGVQTPLEGTYAYSQVYWERLASKSDEIGDKEEMLDLQWIFGVPSDNPIYVIRILLGLNGFLLLQGGPADNPRHR